MKDNVVGQCGIMPDRAEDRAGQCKTSQDNEVQCRTERDSAGQGHVRIMQDKDTKGQ